MYMKMEKEFNKEDLEFFLPNSFKGLSKDYILDKVFNSDIQKNWKPQEGDIIVGCTGNIFVISSKQHLHESLGGDLYFFGGSLCSRDGGNFMNTTQSYVMNKDGFKFDGFEEYHIASFSDFRFVPYPHEIN